MYDIFISYSRDDWLKVEPIVKGLKEERWTAWMDTRIRAGMDFELEIEQALDTARSVVVFWSQSAVKSDWVRLEANEGLKRKILISIAIEGRLNLPLRFRNIQTESIIDWDGDKSSHSFRKIVNDLESILGKSPRHADEIRRHRTRTENLPDLQDGTLQKGSHSHPKTSYPISRPQIPPRRKIESQLQQTITPSQLRRMREIAEGKD